MPPSQVFQMETFARARVAVISAIDGFQKAKGRWPKNAQELLAGGSIDFSYLQNGTRRSATLTSRNLQVAIKNTSGPHAPIYAFRIYDLQQEDVWFGKQ